MITWDSFFHPLSQTHKRIKWVTILLLLLVGSAMLLYTIPRVVAFERNCKSPVYVEATISVEQSGFIIVSYDSYLSYTYQGVDYNGIYYRGNQNPLMMQDDRKTITVAIDPDNPAQLIRDLLPGSAVCISLVFLSIGFSILIYGVSVESKRIYRWRIKANRTGPYVSTPDYPKDLFIVFLPILILVCTIFALLFPNAFRGIT